MKRTTLTTAKRLALLASLSLLFIASASAQTTSTSASDSTTPPGLTPGAPAGSYSLSGFEDINLYNGNLNFHLPLLHLGGRGTAGYQMTFALNSKQWSVLHSQTASTESWTPTVNMLGNTDGYYGAGKMYGRQTGFDIKPTSNCLNWPSNKRIYETTLTTITFVSPDGTEYDFRDQQSGGQRLAVTDQCPASPYVGGSRGTVWVTADGSGVTFVSDGDIADKVDVPLGQRTFPPSGYMLLKDGTRYRIDSGSVSWIRDRNGNTVTFGTNGAFATDSLGRSVTVEAGVTDPTYGLCDRIHYTGYGGVERIIYVTKGSLGSALRSDYSLQTGYQLFQLNITATDPYNPTVYTGVVLPNGRSYKLRYNSYGELARVVLPTGGAIEYDMVPGSGVVDGNNGQGDAKEIYRRVAERRTYPDGSTLEGRTVYTEHEDASSAYVEVKSYSGSTVIGGSRHYFSGGLAIDNIIQQIDGDGSPVDTYPPWDRGKEIATEQYATDGTNLTARLRLTNTAWQPNGTMGGFSVNPVVATTTTTLTDVTPNLVTKTTSVNPANGALGFDQFNNQTDVWEYDYGSGAAPAYPVRHTHTDYLTTNTVNGIDYTSQSGAHIRNLPRASQIYSVNPQNGAESTAPVAQSETKYDEYGLTTYGSVTGWNDPGTAWGYPGSPARGLATTQRRWLDTSNTWLESHASYDQVGNVVSVTDPRGIASTVSYGDSFSDQVNRNTYALPTSTTSAVPDPSGQRGSSAALTTSTVYDYYTSHVFSFTDANGQVTTADYTDGLDRLKQVNRPDGGQTTYEYYDDPTADLYLRTLTKLDATRQIETRQYFDGLGRKTRSFLYDGSTPNPWSVTDSYYDALGQPAQVSNPYRVASPGGGVPATCAVCTTTAYDALGRVKTVTTPDAAVVTTSYSGNRVTVTDQAGKQRRSVSDALGRLVRVDEPDAAGGNLDDAGGNPVQPTYYAYDTLGNLRQVTQGTQQRYFMYDSLSRLIRAKNPEQDANTNLLPAATDPVTNNSQWSMYYDYDADGNLWHRTDARNVTATYTYDNLNRLVRTDYSDGTAYTQNTYDFATNGKGRFYADYESSTQGTINLVLAYDAAGRPASRKTNFYLSGTSWVDGFATSRQYDLAGDVTSQTYPSGHAVAYSYDAAGRLADNGASPAFSGSLGDGTQRTYAGGLSYDAAGRLQQEQFATQTPLYHKLHYNVRGQLYDVRLSSVQWQAGTGAGQWDWNRGALINYYSQNDVNSSTNDARANSGPDDNGNLKRSDVYVPTDANATYDGVSSYGSYFTAQSTYSYDALNRLTQDGEANYNTASGWGQAVSQGYSYDRWGNRTSTSATGGAPSRQFDAGDLANTNRLYAPGDTSLPAQQRQMQYDAAGNLKYDGYTGAGARTYNAENRMTSARGGDAVAGTYDDTYAYDAKGRRTRRTVNGVTTWQIYGFDGELVAEYAPGAAFTQPQKEYGYRAGELLVVASASSGGWGAAPTLHDNPLEVGKTTVQSRHITELRQAIDALRSHLGLAAYQWQADATVGALIKVDAISEMRTALDQALGAPSGGYSAGLAQGQLVRAVHIQELRNRVLAAWQGGTGAAGVRWLVSDHLGTPRMEADQTGSLTGISRHDYLPFGEEIGAGVGGRTQAQGYGLVDNVRQHLTGKERDNETGLDYFGARYYGSTLGRFISVDPLTASAHTGNPQTWNRYVYVLNRPTVGVDPNGLSIIVVTVEARSTIYTDAKGHEHHGSGDASISVYDKNGRDVNIQGRTTNTIPGRAVGAKGSDRTKEGNDTPFGVYKILPNHNGSNANGTQGGVAGQSARPNDTRYGTGLITMEPVSGEATDNGRSSIFIHGGGRPLEHALDDHQPLTPTEGCVRVDNTDINALIGTVNDQAKNGDAVVNVFIGDTPTLNGIADERDTQGNFLYPELRNAGYGTVNDDQGHPPGNAHLPPPSTR